MRRGVTRIDADSEKKLISHGFAWRFIRANPGSSAADEFVPKHTTCSALAVVIGTKPADSQCNEDAGHLLSKLLRLDGLIRELGCGNFRFYEEKRAS
ncbi:MAG TPA: hypothetical protein DCK99_06510 [Blastocatellia bacterium]|nr:hypothetical protein [Blastocatellia bacterium]